AMMSCCRHFALLWRWSSKAHTVRGAILVAGAAAASLAAQEPPRFQSGVDLVTVTATVTDRDDRFVSGLSRNDFAIFEDAQPRHMRYRTLRRDLLSDSARRRRELSDEGAAAGVRRLRVEESAVAGGGAEGDWGNRRACVRHRRRCRGRPTRRALEHENAAACG